MLPCVPEGTLLHPREASHWHNVEFWHEQKALLACYPTSRERRCRYIGQTCMALASHGKSALCDWRLLSSSLGLASFQCFCKVLDVTSSNQLSGGWLLNSGMLDQP